MARTVSAVTAGSGDPALGTTGLYGIIKHTGVCNGFFAPIRVASSTKQTNKAPRDNAEHRGLWLRRRTGIQPIKHLV